MRTSPLLLTVVTTHAASLNLFTPCATLSQKQNDYLQQIAQAIIFVTLLSALLVTAMNNPDAMEIDKSFTSDDVAYVLGALTVLSGGTFSSTSGR